jgi:tetratricopeptide (TPR) repeat protein
MIRRSGDIKNELARMAAGTMRTVELLEASNHLMASAQGAQWSQAAAYHGRALYSLGRVADGFEILEEAWQRANSLDDPVAGAIATQMGADCSVMLHDYVQAERWCRRELERRRSRLIPSLRYPLSDLLASVRVSQGDIQGSHEALAEWEGAAANHGLLVYHEGDWDRSIVLFRKALDRTRAAGQLLAAADYGALLGRIARIANQRVEAEAILDDALQTALTWPDLGRELFIRIELALIASDLGQFGRAKEELRRSKEILDNGEDWRGHRGSFLHTCALVKAAEHIIKFVSSDGRWHVALHRRSAQLPDEVAEGFRAAIEIFRRYHAPWEETASLLYWSQALFAASQIRQSFEKYEAAFAIFDQIATPQWKERIQPELFHFIILDTLSEPLTVGDGTGPNVFRKEGDYWTISFCGSMLRLRDTIGMHYISRLLANPGMDFAAQDLVNIAQKTKPKRAGRNTRVARTNESANGKRHDGDADVVRERARLMVTKRIKDVIARIRQSHPDLARHLATHIRTGYTCRYEKADVDLNSWMT